MAEAGQRAPRRFTAEGMVRLGGVLVGVSGLFDMMDGLVAKIGKRQSRFGALLDSTVDRYAELAIFIGLFIDKPFAGNLADAVEIFRLARKHNVPCWSSSSSKT